MNSRTPFRIRCQVLSALVLLAASLLVAACGVDQGSTSESSTGPEQSNGEAASNDSAPSEVTDAIERMTSETGYEHSTWGFSVRDLSTGEILLDRSGD